MHRSFRRLPRGLATLACIAIVLSPAPGPAATAEAEPAVVVTSIDNDGLLEIMRGEGYSADVDESGVVIWKIEGFRAHLFIAKADGASIQFHVSFSDGNATLKKVNEWNRTKRYSRTYLDEDGDPHLELDLDLEGGVTEARIIDFLTTCRVSFDAWCGEVVE